MKLVGNRLADSRPRGASLRRSRGLWAFQRAACFQGDASPAGGWDDPSWNLRRSPPRHKHPRNLQRPSAEEFQTCRSSILLPGGRVAQLCFNSATLFTELTNERPEPEPLTSSDSDSTRSRFKSPSRSMKTQLKCCVYWLVGSIFSQVMNAPRGGAPSSSQLGMLGSAAGT